MKKLLFLAFLALVFRAGVKLGKEKTRRRYPSVSVKVGSDIAEFNSGMAQIQASLEKEKTQ